METRCSFRASRWNQPLKIIPSVQAFQLSRTEQGRDNYTVQARSRLFYLTITHLNCSEYQGGNRESAGRAGQQLKFVSLFTVETINGATPLTDPRDMRDRNHDCTRTWKKSNEFGDSCEFQIDWNSVQMDRHFFKWTFLVEELKRTGMGIWKWEVFNIQMEWT